MTLARRHALLASTAALLAPQLARAQQGEQAAVAQAVEALTKAMLEVNKAELERLTSRHLSYGHSGGRVENQAQFIAYLEGRESAFRRIDLSEQTVSLAGDEAIVRHLFTAEIVDKAGKATPVKIGVLQVWTKEPGHWVLLARQAYRL
ncbi:nuclear transport factor 2 family protein [Roseicella aquatilis]|uniref:Nuclear transport factor 2 family protein n=1 Tax=Roseicella aquatilis TaxID=2527868 RepID=A0A4R4DXI8_9PROT|nr:nuclear transport factor 2 family protein [Roseicella aquatilis]TCZ65570.1 nuclear transport factor 2 family protein [Roseicella aquatilis]